MLNANLVAEALCHKTKASYSEEVQVQLEKVEKNLVKIFGESYECEFPTVLAIIDEPLHPEVLRELKDNGWKVDGGENGNEYRIESPKID